MTTPGTTTSPEASPVLGQDPDRPAGAASAADGEMLDQVHADLVEASAAEASDDVTVQPTVGAYRDGDGRVHYASPYSKATRDHLASGEWAGVDAAEPAFDPTEHLVREVLAHLEKHASDTAEIERVKTAEAAGEGRPTIAQWTAPVPD